MLNFYNTLIRKKQEFKPLKDKGVGIYSCGPTVYWYQHIGNLRSYIFSDILKRVLEYDGYKTKHVMNITDVGHLTSDADSGEDKMEKAATKEGKSAKEISNYYWKIFRDDFKKLNIIEPDIWCKATEHIKEQVDLIEKLEEKGFTYKTADGIYFDTSKFKNYGQLAKKNIEGIESGKRVKMRDKKNPTDFALWKFSEKPGIRQQEWKSPWGVGFPGWHIECSAMSMKYLGETFDIHTGGEDHISIHHTNEIAQSEASTGKKFVNFWLHGAFLTFKGEKVSKSKGGLYTISGLEEKGFNPLAYRYLCLTAHYRSPLGFNLDSLKSAENAYDRLKNIVQEIKNDKKIHPVRSPMRLRIGSRLWRLTSNGVNEKYLNDFKNAINDDLDMPKAIAILWNLIRDKNAVGKLGTIKEMDKVLGLDLLKKEKKEIPAAIKKLAIEREKARKNKDWQKADELRKQIEKSGYLIEDTENGPKLRRK
ncbi:cysteine--tRNA ligase [Patescibacteria group bacterium]|nr:cysteine--tRNA ligase [Patescibacteria group bacterium]